jgi:hypothetical protein
MLPAQCASQWLPGDAVPGVDGGMNPRVTVMTLWDPDRGGPLAPQLVVGGTFEVAGQVVTGGLARCDLATGQWKGFGIAELARVEALAVLPNGDLVAAGVLPLATGVVARVARFDGSTWTPLGTLPVSTQRAVSCLRVMPNGDLWLGGQALDGSPSTCLMRWDSQAWQSLGVFTATPLLPGGPAWVNDPVVAVVQELPNGDVVAGGWFTTVDGTFTEAIARWDGAAWHALGSGVTMSPYAPTVTGLALDANLDLIVCGVFVTAGGVPVESIARWDGVAWHSLGIPAVGSQGVCSILATGQIVGTRRLSSTYHSRHEVLLWSGSAWIVLGETAEQLGVSWVTCFQSINSTSFAVGGFFASVSGTPASNVALYDAGVWRAPTPGTQGAVRCLQQTATGEVIAAGEFHSIGGTRANCIARQVSGTWTSLGTGIDKASAGTTPYSEVVLAVACLPNGDVVAAGRFGGAGGVPVNNIARWDGVAWHALGSGLEGRVHCLAVLSNGDLVAGGFLTMAGGVAVSHTARWDGTTWHAFAQMHGTSGGEVQTMLVRANGDLVCAGAFTHVNGNFTGPIVKWDGSSWQRIGVALPPLASPVRALHETADQRLFASNSTLHVFDGVTWLTVGAWPAGVSAITSLPNGDVVAAGQDWSGGPSIGRWSGTTWSDLGSVGSDSCYAALVTHEGELLVGGDFRHLAGGVRPFLARWNSDCPAAATAYGAGCAGSGGTNTLVATALPWQGGIFRSRADGLPNPAIAVSVVGLAPMAWPLATVFGQALPGCDLLATPDVLELHLANGSLATQFAVTATPTLLGVPLHQQIVAIAFDPQFQFVEMTSTNALQLTVGAY